MVLRSRRRFAALARQNKFNTAGAPLAPTLSPLVMIPKLGRLILEICLVRKVWIRFFDKEKGKLVSTCEGLVALAPVSGCHTVASACEAGILG